MRVSRLFPSATVLAFIQAVLASDVLDLTPANFDSTIKPESLMLVEFFAPWYEILKASFFVRTPDVCAQVRSLQGSGSPLRGGCYQPQGEEH